MYSDERAQTNIDFLFGLAVFLMGFLYVFTFVPGLFVPYQAGAIDLGSVAYRTGAILVEDPGWYIFMKDGEEVGNPAWETQDLSKLARIGLAGDRTTPNVLSIDKIDALNDIDDYALIRDKIGLNGSIRYNYRLSLVMNNTLRQQQEELIDIPSPFWSLSTEYMERNVLVDTGKQLHVDGYSPNLPTAVLVVNIGGMLTDDYHNVTIRAYNMSGAGTVERVMWQVDPLDMPVPLVYNSQYTIRKNGVVMPVIPVAFTEDDVVEIVIYNDEIRSVGMKYLWVVSLTNVFPGDQIDYYDDPKYPLKSVCYPGVLAVEVWSDEL